MAVIQCPDCGGKVSDKLKNCPHCGAPVLPSPRTVGISPAHKSQGEVGISTQVLKCPNCGEPLQQKDILSSGLAHCPACHKDVFLNGINGQFVDGGIVEMILPFSITKEEFHRKCMEALMKDAPKDIYSSISNIKVTKHYFWVREFGNALDRQICPLDKYGEDFIKKINNDNRLPVNADYDKWWNVCNMKNFTSDDVMDCNVHAKERTAKDVVHIYSVDPNSRGLKANDYYYCLPVMEESFDYNGRTYTFQAVGTANTPKFYTEDRPIDATLSSQPKYFKGRPFSITVGTIIALAVIFFVITLFKENGFWGAVLYLVIIGVVLSFVGVFVGGAIIGPCLLVDKLLQTAINKPRQLKFRQLYDSIQAKKKADAKSLYNFDFEYEVPKFPLP